MNLSDLFTTAEVMLQLEPEDMAGVLMASAQRGRRRWETLNGVLFSVPALPFPTLGGGHDPAWPLNRRMDIEGALATALMWLERELLIVKVREPRTTNGIIYLFTPRGLQLHTEQDVAVYREGSLLPEGLVHPMIAGKVIPMVQRGDHPDAVFTAFRAVEIAVRAAASQPAEAVGVNLMRSAFHPTSGPLTDPNLPNAEREAEAALFAGAIGHAKNPGSHRDVEVSRKEAARLILFASYLLSLVDSRVATRSQAPDPP